MKHLTTAKRIYCLADLLASAFLGTILGAFVFPLAFFLTDAALSEMLGGYSIARVLSSHVNTFFRPQIGPFTYGTGLLILIIGLGATVGAGCGRELALRRLRRES